MLLVYLIRNFFFTIFLFFKHWYVDGWYWAYGAFLRVMRMLERHFAVRINLHYLAEPLYQQYNIAGYLIGFVFRSFRIVAGGVVYLIIAVLVLTLFIAWALVPLYLLYRSVGFLY
jgi:hypothetical protein